MKISLALLPLIFLWLTALVAADCITNEQRASRLVTPLSGGNQITFDDQGFSSLSFPVTSLILANTGSQTITLNGTRCEFTRSTVGFGSGWWDGAKNWDGEQTNPGYYWYAASSSAACAMTFTTPISEFTMRLNSYDAQTPPYMDLYDADNELMTCIQLPAVPSQNRWSTIGFRGKKQISRFVIRNSLIALDNVVWSPGCPAGQTLNGSNCVDLNECDLGYCNANAECRNVNDEAVCECKSGYVGDGYGPDGCTVAPISDTPPASAPVLGTPMASPTSSPSNTPSSSPSNTPSNTPTSLPSNTPIPDTPQNDASNPNTAPQTPVNSIVSSANLLHFGISTLLALLFI